MKESSRRADRLVSASLALLATGRRRVRVIPSSSSATISSSGDARKSGQKTVPLASEWAMIRTGVPLISDTFIRSSETGPPNDALNASFSSGARLATLPNLASVARIASELGGVAAKFSKKLRRPSAAGAIPVADRQCVVADNAANVYCFREHWHLIWADMGSLAQSTTNNDEKTAKLLELDLFGQNLVRNSTFAYDGSDE